MEEDIIYYLFNERDIQVFKNIQNAFSLRSLQIEIYIQCDEPYWYQINTFDDFIKLYGGGKFATVSYAIENPCDINLITFSYMFDGYLLVGFYVNDSSKVDFPKIERVFRGIKYIGKRITVERMPFETRESFFKE